MADQEVILNRLNHLSEIKKNSDIFGDCNAISGGIFCPTYGIVLCATQIKDVAVIVIGTPECTWYAKNACVNYCDALAYDRFYSCVMDDNDITFGDSEGIKEAIYEVSKDKSINCIIITTTCIPELIGCDLDGIAMEAEQETNIPIIPIHIAHYDHKCYEFGIAISNVLEGLGRIMEPHKLIPKTINILGKVISCDKSYLSMNALFKDTELVSLLRKHGCSINLILPSECSTEEIKSAPSAALNIVTSFVGEKIAEYMNNEFGTPYVLFKPSLDIDYISEGYSKIQDYIGINMEKDVSMLKKEVEIAIEKSKIFLEGKSFVNGGRPPDSIEVASFLVDMGMEPLLINTARLSETSEKYVSNILNKGWNPYINYVANPDVLFSLLSKYSPDIFIGPICSEYLDDFGIKYAENFAPQGKLGYEVVKNALFTITSALKGDE